MPGDNERAFESLLRQFVPGINETNPARPNVDDIRRAGLYDEVFSTYKRLGGILDEAPSNAGKYDFVLADKIVELDEEAHFNRYRAITLQSKIYNDISSISMIDYLEYCRREEETCLRTKSGGGFWSNHSSIKQFWGASPNGDLSGDGSPR